MEIARVRKLKYRLANDMLYRILNVSYIFKYDSKKHCSCDKFHGCPFINGEKSYCKICQITVRYDTKNYCACARNMLSQHKKVCKFKSPGRGGQVGEDQPKSNITNQIKIRT